MSEATERESKTEEPTEKRLADTIRKGKGPLSRELPALLNVCAILLVLSVLTTAGSGELGIALRPFIESPGMWSVRTSGDVAQILAYVGYFSLAAILPAVAVLAISGAIGFGVQSGGLAFERIRPETSRLSPSSGLKRIFGRAGWVNAVKALIKLIFVGAIAVKAVKDLGSALLATENADTLGQTIVTSLTRLVAYLAVAFAGIACLDMVLVRMNWRRDLMMTKQEVKDESKEADGDPVLKHRMRLIARQRFRKRMIAAVPRATVVIVNPTHYAVALRYVQNEGGAPRVVAKGRDRIALRIRGVGQSLGIPVVENRLLARALHDQVPVDSYIPQDFYKAVAQIISFLTKHGSHRAGSPSNAP